MNNEEIGMLKEAILDSMESYIDTIMDSLPFAKIEIGRILGMGSEKGNKVVINRVIYKGEIIKEGITYDNVLAVGNFRYSVGDMVYLCVPNGQYGNMFIMGTMGKNRTNDKALQDLTDVEISSTIEDNSLLTYDEIKHQWTSRKLPIASADKLGVVKVGDNVSIDENGALSAEIPIASSTTLGGVKVGDNLSITEDGVLSASSSAGGGSAVEWNQIQDSGNKIAEVTIDGAMTEVFSPNGSSSLNYSTEEQIVGTWIDGKPIYQKVIDNNGSPLPRSIDISSLNIDIIIDMDGVGSDYSPYDAKKWVISTVTGNSSRMLYTTDNNTLIRDGSYNCFYIILRYTKTTDL